jgi:hypothetical protein
MSFSHESPYSSRISAAAESPLVSRTSFHAVSCDFPTADISNAQALLFESAGCAAGPAGAHKYRRAASPASVRTGSRSPGGLARSPGRLARSCGTHEARAPPGCVRAHTRTHAPECLRPAHTQLAQLPCPPAPPACPALSFGQFVHEVHNATGTYKTQNTRKQARLTIL